MLFNPQTFSSQQASLLNNIPGRSLADTNTPTQISAAQAVSPPVPGPIRTLQGAGNTAPAAILAGDQPSSGDQFASIINLLKQYQSGANTGLNQTQNQQIQRGMTTPQSLIGASPGEQNAVREASMGALSPTIGGYKDVIAQAKATIQDYTTAQNQARDDARAVINGILTSTDLASLHSLDKNEISMLEKNAGYPKGFLDNAVTYKQKQALQAAQKTRQTTSNTVNSDISGPDDKRFKIAQDLAYGKLSFQQFRTLYAYSRQTGDKVAIYNKASELNPNFDPSAFELGLKFAGDAQSRRQIAAADNVLAGVGPLIEASDAAARSGVPLLNKAILGAGYTLGGVHYATFAAAQKAFADEVSGALGFGTASDMKLALGIDLTDKNLSPAAFRDVIQNTVVPFVQRKRQAILNQFGNYGKTVSGFSNPQVSGGSFDASSARSKYNY